MRRHYLDNIRWITVVIVVLYHVLYMYNAEGIVGGVGKITNLNVQYYDIFQYFVYPWFMPLLFIVAGISSRIYLDKHSDKDFISARTLKLLVPSTIGLFAFQFIQGYINISLGTAFQDLPAMGVPKPVIFLIMVASGSGVLWFMHLLWLYSMVLILLRKIEKNRLLELGAKTPIWMVILLYLPVWGAAQILNTPIVVVYRFGFYFAFFMLGYFVFSNDEVMEKLKKYTWGFMIFGFLLCISFSVLYFLVQKGKNYADVPINRGPLFAACAYFGSLAVLSGMARYLDFTNSFLTWMSKKSFGLYVFHYLGISSMAFIFAKNRLLPPLACYMLSLVAGFAFGYGLYEIISRIPFFRWAVLGIKKK
ncbi:Peptidoglycan/LPS O-acetylase OafA/YrhL, contains acyltransferase and SGNH-hydrolase domains [Butyrivibrio proteoclasticus]|uniref:Peptidoglycan/LPS O-acetylase OafA/YrhL, contains acyltransferase and SGNH-hydrolase domains n=1 Tax=Butyrivibrio proteoclasticus TaxID=43305 RepID=A0A1I5USY3_9FIRM|nr:acyltransferase [Butyrivibrio proteoclasticus]SFP98137.1 Peptidoglycan/LPS O-acetylase OafA/YrhL, contains acyltransferase and SGNH-hydrolase domains [Butyrivibrio proteoclasticus]